ncbi:U6 snRNA phosphodiesterase isoform X2 [Venturia canescens]|uniref:U6 snRNA phosphodiesterase isoform X2 n=1 Tax=Venturia canescens TaxID=32260 RepID=UPI001C9C4B92|nr:U6 snRNA phosphodiesterase isoform X2 [Venturia canescens]
MAGFSAIQTYASDSEDDEAEYETHKIGETAEKLGGSDQPPRLPLPESILKFKGVPHHEEVVDNPADHEGRTRSFKHERGNWATHIFAKYEPSSSVRLWVKHISSEFPVTALPEFHISFSRTVVLKFHWIESFVESLKKLLSETNRFEVELQDVKVYLNDDKNRTFVAIQCTGVDDSPKHLVESLNKVLAEYGLPAYYEFLST